MMDGGDGGGGVLEIVFLVHDGPVQGRSVCFLGECAIMGRQER